MTGSATAGLARGRIRDLLTNLAGALLAVVLFKWFGCEAYRIPSPSMQPVLLGSIEAGVHDHVLVDKLHYLFAEPKRWDLAVFHAPLQRRDTFVKRIVGMPGERVAIAGGNLYSICGDPGAGQWQVLRRPARLQETLWRELHPA
ncbi:MAG: signal peptidase I, partial [Planctomycetes bacterium]|nr:signal peptidase I [Planctomycetota bacterium]